MARSPYARVSDVKDGFDEVSRQIKALPVGGDMQKANNLADLPDKAAARDNLEVYSTAEVDAAIAASGGGGGGGSGDVVGPAGASDGALAQFDGATGKLLKSGPSLGVGAAGSVPTRADADARYLHATQLGVVNGVASLGADVKVPTAQLPPSGAGGDVTGPASATADAPAVFSGTTGKVIKVGAFPVLSVAGLTGAIASAALKTALALVKGDVGLGNVDNTSDANKPVSTAQQAALDLKAALSDTLVTVSTTTYTVLSSDLGKTLRFTNAAGCAVTLPNNLPAGFNCLWRHIGAGAVTFAAQAGGTLNNRQNHTKSAGPKAEGALAVDTNSGANAAWWLSGDTVA